MHYMIVRSGDVIFKEGDFSDKLYFIKTGSFTVSRMNKFGENEVVHTLGDNDVFGEIGVIAGTTRGATITALTSGEIYFITKDQFETFLVENPGSLRPFFKAMVNRLREKLPQEI